MVHLFEHSTNKTLFQWRTKHYTHRDYDYTTDMVEPMVNYRVNEKDEEKTFLYKRE